MIYTDVQKFCNTYITDNICLTQKQNCIFQLKTSKDIICQQKQHDYTTLNRFFDVFYYLWKDQSHKGE